MQGQVMQTNSTPLATDSFGPFPADASLRENIVLARTNFFEGACRGQESPPVVPIDL